MFADLEDTNKVAEKFDEADVRIDDYDLNIDSRIVVYARWVVIILIVEMVYQNFV